MNIKKIILFMLAFSALIGILLIGFYVNNPFDEPLYVIAYNIGLIIAMVISVMELLKFIPEKYVTRYGGHDNGH